MVQKSGEKATWDVQNIVNNGINDQPQLVSRISEPSIVSKGINSSTSHKASVSTHTKMHEPCMEKFSHAQVPNLPFFGC